MSLEICILGSGSGGNSTLVRGGGGVFMIDAGLGPRVLAKRLQGTGVNLTDIRAICLTHLDSDHFNTNIAATITQQQIPVFCHQQCVEELCQRVKWLGRDKCTGFSKLVRSYTTEEYFAPLEGWRLQAVHLAHDLHGSHGFLIEVEVAPAVRRKLGYATDLGRVPRELVELFCGVDMLALESNYDPDMEKNSSRPWHLKQRVMGGAGHLSNPQALAAIQEILDLTVKHHGQEKMPRHIVLLHRSRECNCPKLLRTLFEKDKRIKRVLTLAEQHERTAWLRLDRLTPLVGEQMGLQWE